MSVISYGSNSSIEIISRLAPFKIFVNRSVALWLSLEVLVPAVIDTYCQNKKTAC